MSIQSNAQDAQDVALIRPTLATFHFREKVTKGEDGEKVVTPKRESLPLSLPYLTLEGLVEAINGDDKVLPYLLEEINQTIYTEAKVQVDDNLELTQESLDLALLTLAKLARKPKSEGRGGGVAKEVWAAFVKHYILTVPALTGSTTAKISTAAGIFNRRLADVRSNKEVLSFLQTQLAVWFTKADGSEEFALIYEILNSKITSFLEAETDSMLDKLI